MNTQIDTVRPTRATGIGCDAPRYTSIHMLVAGFVLFFTIKALKFVVDEAGVVMQVLEVLDIALTAAMVILLVAYGVHLLRRAWG